MLYGSPKQVLCYQTNHGRNSLLKSEEYSKVGETEWTVIDGRAAL